MVTVFPAGATTNIRLKYRTGPEVGLEADERSLKNPVTVNVIRPELKKIKNIDKSANNNKRRKLARNTRKCVIDLKYYYFN
jgi:hypothetical protein